MERNSDKYADRLEKNTDKRVSDVDRIREEQLASLESHSKIQPQDLDRIKNDGMYYKYCVRFGRYSPYVARIPEGPS